MSPRTDREEQPASRHVAAIVTVIVGIALILNSLGAVIALENNQARIKQIQRERVSAVLRNCVDQNQRHDRTIRELDRLIRHVRPSQRTRAVQSRAGTVLLINSLAPKRDCRRLASQAVPSG